jgi:hypothetical protein
LRLPKGYEVGGSGLDPIDERFFDVVGALVTLDDDESGGKIPYRSLALNYSRPDQTDKTVESTLSRYLKRKFRARAASAIDLGEALCESGVLWCSGWWMLYAAGRYDAYVFVTAHAIEAMKRSRESVDLVSLWKMIVGAHELCLRTQLDDHPAVAKLHREHAQSIARANRIYCQARPMEQSTHESNIAFIRRETAKAAYRTIDSLRPYLAHGYSQFFASFSSTSHQKNMRTLTDRNALGALALASASGIPLHQKEFLVRHHLKNQIESLTSGHRKVLLKEYELSSVLTRSPLGEPFSNIEDPFSMESPFGVDIDDDRMVEALSRISAPWFYEDEEQQGSG